MTQSPLQPNFFLPPGASLTGQPWIHTSLHWRRSPAALELNPGTSEVQGQTHPTRTQSAGIILAFIFVEPIYWWLAVLKIQIMSPRQSSQGLMGPTVAQRFCCLWEVSTGGMPWGGSYSRPTSWAPPGEQDSLPQWGLRGPFLAQGPD